MANNVNVVNRGFEYTAAILAGSVSSFSVPTWIGWGGANGYNSASVVMPGAAPTGFPSPGPSTAGTGQWSDVAPYQEFTEARVLGTTSVVLPAASGASGNSYATTQIVGTITAGSNETVAESFLMPSSTKATSYSLNANLTAGAAGFTVNTGTLVNNAYYQVNNEVIKVTTTASNTQATVVVRGANGSTAGTAKTNDVITIGNPPGAGTPNPNNGDMYAHAGFVGLALNTNDSIQFTWQINITS